MILSSAAQQFVLRFVIVRETHWFRYTFLGAMTVGLFFFIIPALLLEPLGAFDPDLGPQDSILWALVVGVSYLGIIASLLGVSVGQTHALHRQGLASAIWLLACPLGWSLGMGSIVVAGGSAAIPSGLISRGLFGVYLAIGGIAGGITGAALIYILRVRHTVTAQGALLRPGS